MSKQNEIGRVRMAELELGVVKLGQELECTQSEFEYVLQRILLRESEHRLDHKHKRGK